MRAVRPVGIVAAVVMLGSALSACGDGSEPHSLPSATLSWTPTADSSDLVSASAPPKAGKSGSSDIWQFDLPDPQDPNVPSSQWPAAKEVVSKSQLKAAFPKAKKVTATSALKLQYNGGGSDPGPKTAKNSQVTWQITMAGSRGGPSTLTVEIRAIGADAKMTQAWQKHTDSAMQNKIATDTFYERGTFGAKGVYLLQNNRASVLISDGDMAAWIDLSFGAFYSLADTPVDARQVLEDDVFPLIVQDIASHMPRRYA